jgi:hypothetical protein
LPVLDTGQGMGFTNLMSQNSQFAYEYIWAGQMPYFVKRIHENDVLNPNLDKKDELMKLDEESVVIFEYEFR